MPNLVLHHFLICTRGQKSFVIQKYLNSRLVVAILNFSKITCTFFRVLRPQKFVFTKKSHSQHRVFTFNDGPTLEQNCVNILCFLAMLTYLLPDDLAPHAGVVRYNDHPECPDVSAEHVILEGHVYDLLPRIYSRKSDQGGFRVGKVTSVSPLRISPQVISISYKNKTVCKI